MGAILLVLATTAACGDSDERSLCDAYAEYLATVQGLAESQVAEVTVAEAVAALEDIEAEVAQLRAVADTQNEAMVDDLDQRLGDLINTLTSLDDDVPFDTIEDLITDDVDAVVDAAETVRDEFDPICNMPD